MLDRLGKASAFVTSLPTEVVTPSPRQTQDISRSRFRFKDVSASRGFKIQPVQPTIDKIEQELIKELVSYFE